MKLADYLWTIVLGLALGLVAGEAFYRLLGCWTWELHETQCRWPEAPPEPAPGPY